jgi:hypothetical protein
MRAFRSISGRTVKIFAAVVQKIEEVEDEAGDADAISRAFFSSL